MEKIKTIFSSNTEDQNETTGIVDDLWKNSTLSWSTRVKGFALMFILGVITSILASIFFWLGVGGLTLFGVLYTLGNICSLSSTLFLMGPVSQIKKMFASTRWIATVVMLASLILTLVSAFVLDSGILVLLFIVIQFLAMLWYSISYIPFARDAVKKLLGSIVS